MEFGYTIPLQKHVGIKRLGYGTEPSRLFCWDMHVIRLHGRECLLAVNCANRYTVAAGMAPADWNRLPAAALGCIRAALLADGFPQAQVERYLEQAGNVRVTRTHGRREVAFLNRAWDDAVMQDWLFDPQESCQFLLNRGVNGVSCRCAGHEGIGIPQERMALDLKENSEHVLARRQKRGHREGSK